jgi:hypothetical protein
MPEWAIEIAIYLAFLREDTETAIEQLEELVARGISNTDAKLKLADCLVDLGRYDDARIHIEAIEGTPNLSPIQRMQLAQLLVAIGEGKRALPMAFDAYRCGRGEPRIHRGFIGAVHMSKMELEEPIEVGPDTHVVLENNEGESIQYTIIASNPIDPIRHEIDVKTACELDLIGKGHGDVIIRNKGTFHEQSLTIKCILPAIVHAFQDAVRHYEDRFPGEDFFLKRYSAGKETSIKYLAPLISSLSTQRREAERILSLHQKQIFPLGAVAKYFGVSIAEVMANCASYPKVCGPVFAEWGNHRDQRTSLYAAANAKSVVLTRSALHSLVETDMLEECSEIYNLTVPRSLVEELRKEFKRAERNVEEGVKTIYSGDIGINLDEVEPGDQRLIVNRDKIQYLLNWINISTNIEPRPLDEIHQQGSKREESRDLFGNSSFDAIVLAERGYSLFADDLGLRRLLQSPESRINSFSSIAMLLALAHKGVITADKRNKCLVNFVQAGYVHIAPSVSLLEWVLQNSQDLGQGTIHTCFDLLHGPCIGEYGAAEVIGDLLRGIALRPIQIVPLRTVVELSLRSMASRWHPRICSALVYRAAEGRLSLLPQQLQTVRDVCERFSRGTPQVLDLPKACSLAESDS